MNWQELRAKALQATRTAIAQSVTDDNLIVQSINAIEELDRHANTLVRRLREWYELYSPEFSKAVADNEAFTKRILEKTKDEQLQELGVVTSMGASLAKSDVDEIHRLATTILSMYEEREHLEQYVEKVMTRHCPNITVLAGPTIAAKLLKEAGSLRRLATIQAGTIQLYGAEKALFRHLKTGAKPPKYGHIINHPLITKAERSLKGKVARSLADKISIAAKVDYFKGDPIGATLRKELEARFS